MYRGFKPISKAYFATASSKASEQFIYFISLVSWLLAVNQHQVTGWNKYDDPMTASQNVLIELQNLGLQVDVNPNKLKTGYGEGVTLVLLKLTEASLANRFQFRKPVIREEGQGGDDDAEEGGDDMEGDADLANEIHAQDSGEDIDEDLDFGGGNIQTDMARELEADMAQNAMIESNISKEKWQLEVEGIAHKLKLGKIQESGKEWRSHLEQTKTYAEQVRNSLPKVRSKLERLQDDASRALEKISRKEQILSRNFQGMTGDYRAHTDQLREIQTSFTTVSKNVETLESELQEINDRLGTVQRKIDDTGKQFSDNTPLTNIKKAISTVKNDIKAIDIRIGVVSNTLLQLKLKERSKVIEDGKALEILDNEYEIEM